MPASSAATALAAYPTPEPGLSPVASGELGHATGIPQYHRPGFSRNRCRVCWDIYDVRDLRNCACHGCNEALGVKRYFMQKRAKGPGAGQ